jgi:hypothetical protein
LESVVSGGTPPASMEGEQIPLALPTSTSAK